MEQAAERSFPMAQLLAQLEQGLGWLCIVWGLGWGPTWARQCTYLVGLLLALPTKLSKRTQKCGTSFNDKSAALPCAPEIVRTAWYALASMTS